MGKAVVTGDTPAIRSFFSDKETIVLCQPNDALSLANALRLLRDNDELRCRVAQNARILFKYLFSSPKIGDILWACFRDLGVGDM